MKCHVIDTGDRRKEAIFERVTGRSLRKENKGLQYRNRIEKKNRTEQNRIESRENKGTALSPYFLLIE